LTVDSTKPAIPHITFRSPGRLALLCPRFRATIALERLILAADDESRAGCCANDPRAGGEIQMQIRRPVRQRELKITPPKRPYERPVDERETRNRPIEADAAEERARVGFDLAEAPGHALLARSLTL